MQRFRSPATAICWQSSRATPSQPGRCRAMAAGKQASRSVVTEKVSERMCSPLRLLRSTSAFSSSSTASWMASRLFAVAVVAPRRARSDCSGLMDDAAKGVGRWC